MFCFLPFLQLLLLVRAKDYGEAHLRKIPDVSKHKNFALLPKFCGPLSISTYITGGTTTSISQYPWMAQIFNKGANGVIYGCGGSVINERYILTAAHCVVNIDKPLFLVRVGAERLNVHRDENTGKVVLGHDPSYQDLKIKKVISHKHYDPVTNENDIALLRVSKIDLLSGNTRPACLPLAEARTDPFHHKEGIITGWGKTESGKLSLDLLRTAVPFASEKFCKKVWHQIDHRQICAGGMDIRDSCNGDSGGPLVVKGTINGLNTLILQGLVSYGQKDCGHLLMPGVYTKVAAYMDWILDHLKP